MDALYKTIHNFFVNSLFFPSTLEQEIWTCDVSLPLPGEEKFKTLLENS